MDASAETSAPPPAPEGERKQVTVLFADVAKSMDLAERLDPDELSQVMTGLVEVCRDAVEHFGGTIDKFTGDGVMALFGAPMAQEDHASRACHAALRLVERAATYATDLRAKGVHLEVRVGLNSGEVVAGSVAGGSYTAVGHTVGLAQRMEARATPGTSYLTEHTAALVADSFVLRGLGKADIKGSTVPIGVFALEGAAGGTSAAGRRRSGSARMIGRDEEFAALETLLSHASEGRAQVVGLVSEAGGGKSRLSAEIARRATELGVTVRRTAGVSHAQSVPLLPILGLFRDYYEVSPEDTAAEVRSKVGSRILAFDPTLEGELGLIFDFMEAPDPDRPVPILGPDARRRRVLEVFRRITQKRSERQTVLFILEDLHWFDPQSVAFLDAWLPSFPGTRTMILTNFRPGFHPPWMGHSNYRQIPLASLDTSAVGELLRELLGPGEGLAEVAAALLGRTGGNPFFAEEIVRGLAADGTLSGEAGAYELARPASEVRIPPTVQAVLGARIDRLANREKNVLQAAAVIGRTFTGAILGAVLGGDGQSLHDPLRTLCGGELLQETGSADEYRFWHPLTQEVTYGTLLTATRQRMHVLVARALVSAAEPERHEESAALIATHYEAAGVDLETARWQLRAGVSAVRSDYAEAMRRLRSAVDHLAALPEATAETMAMKVRARVVLLRMGARTGMDTAEAERLVTEARTPAVELGDPDLLAWLGYADATFRFYGGDHPGAFAALGPALRDAERGTQTAGRAACSLVLGFAGSYRGPLSESVADAQAGIALCAGDPTVGVAEIGVSIPDMAAQALTMAVLAAGDLPAARRHLAVAVDGFTRRPVAEFRAWALGLYADLAVLTGDPDDALAAANAAAEAAALAHDSGSIAASVRAALTDGSAALLDQRPADAITALTDGLSVARRYGSGRVHEAGLLMMLARSQLACGDAASARERARESVLVARRQDAFVLECLAQSVLARVLRETATDDDDLVEGRAAVATGEALLAQTGALTYAAFLSEERARLEPDSAAQLAGLKLAADAYAAIGATGHARRLKTEITATPRCG